MTTIRRYELPFYQKTVHMPTVGLIRFAQLEISRDLTKPIRNVLAIYVDEYYPPSGETKELLVVGTDQEIDPVWYYYQTSFKSDRDVYHIYMRLEG